MFLHKECGIQGVDSISGSLCVGRLIMFLPEFCPINFAGLLQECLLELTHLCLSVPMMCEHACPGMVVGSTAQHETLAQ